MMTEAVKEVIWLNGIIDMFGNFQKFVTMKLTVKVHFILLNIDFLREI